MIRSKGPIANPFHTLQREDTARTPNWYTTSQASGAMADQIVNELPVVSLHRMAEQNDYFGITSDEDEGKHLSPADLEDKKKTDFYAQFMPMPKDGMSERSYNLMLRDTRERKLREETISRSPQDFSQASKQFFMSLGINIIDPLNIAAGYVPATMYRVGKVALATKSGTVTRAIKKDKAVRRRDMEEMSTGGRAKVRLKEGAFEGVIGGALVEYPIYQAEQMRGEQYSAIDVLANLAFGTILGTTMHVGFGAVGDRLGKRGREIRNNLRADAKQRAETYITGRKKYWKDAFDDFELESWMAEAEANKIRGEAEGPTAIQRRLAKVKAEDKRKLMQGMIAQYRSDQHMNIDPMLKMMDDEVIARYSADDIDEIRAEVILDMIEEDVGAQALTYTPPSVTKSKVDRLRGEINRVKKELKELKKTEGPATPRKRLYKLMEEKEGEISRIEASQKRGTKFSKTMADRIEAARRGEIDPVLGRRIEMELQRRMDIIEATSRPSVENPGVPNFQLKTSVASIRMANQSKARLGELSDTATNPTKARSFDPDASDRLKTKGTPADEAADTVKLMSEEADAEELARASAEAAGIEYDPKADLDDSIAKIDDSIGALQDIALCRSA